MLPIYIFVLDRGFVLIAEAEISDKLALHWHFPRSRTIRFWGTEEGLAELKDGPLPETKLDPICERTTPFRSVLDMIHITSEEGIQKWTKALS